MELVNIDFSDLNPGIRRMVKLMRDNGFDTRDSGDGVTHKYECDMDVPYVHSIVSDASMLSIEADRMYVLLCTELKPEKVSLFDLQANYLPGDRIAVIMVMGVCDADLRERGEE